MAYGKIYETTYWGTGALDNNIGWGGIYKNLIDPTPFFELLAENGDYLLTENNINIITE